MSCGCVKRCRQKELLCELECVVQVKFNVNRVDNMVIQAIALLDTLDKDINTFVMRVREWYSWHFPELVKICADNYQYARLALFIKEKTSLSQDSLPGQALSASCSLNATCGHPSWPPDELGFILTSHYWACQRQLNPALHVSVAYGPVKPLGVWTYLLWRCSALSASFTNDSAAACTEGALPWCPPR